MGFINLGSSIKYGPHGKKRKTNAFKTVSKRTKYNELISQQQQIYDQVMREVKEEIPSLVTNTTGNLTPRQEPMVYSGERKLLGIATMHKSNMVPIFMEDKEHAKDIARMRRS